MDLQKEVGFNCKVLMCASHDTASAVMAVPDEQGNGIYISSGTWSLMGVELMKADCSRQSQEANFTNEGGYDMRFRYLKNIMGLWMIQSVRNELGKKHSFAELCSMAEENKDFPSRVDVNDPSFLAPESMIVAIKEYCKKTNQKEPLTVGELTAVIYESLAVCYGQTVREIEQEGQRQYDKIHVIGGGSNADYLNMLTAKATGMTVYAGPSEATAIGNAMAQMIRDGVFSSLGEARRCVKESFDIKCYNA